MLGLEEDLKSSRAEASKFLQVLTEVYGKVKSIGIYSETPEERIRETIKQAEEEPVH